MRVDLPTGWAPYAVAGDAAGNLWFTVLDPPGLARLDAEGGVSHEPSPAGKPMLLSVGPDDAVWHTRTDDTIIRRDPTGTQEVFALPPGAAPYGIAAVAGGGAWFTAPGLNQVGRVAPGGAVTLIDLPVPAARAAMLAVDADGTAWAALNGAGAIARISGDTVHLVPLPEGSAPVGVTASASGVWYADIARGCVGRIDPSGGVEQFSFADPACRPHAVAADPDGGCWVTLWGSGRLAHVTAAGGITLHDLPGEEPHGLWVSASQDVWVAMESGCLAKTTPER